MLDILAVDIDPAVFAVLANGKPWGREGGIGECSNRDGDDAKLTLYHIGEGWAAFRAEPIGRLMAAVGDALPCFDLTTERHIAVPPPRLSGEGTPGSFLTFKAMTNRETRTDSPSQVANRWPRRHVAVLCIGSPLAYITHSKT
ncbi:hypothetical protein [Phaeobacter inhibens]|jgi:hypothetical protein|uniref:Uncharacterized protein n=1 Tax=Phaeobacter inhibens TaxID=221822 RepID=A0A2I7KGC6_9RHOB|nr:hypothetical protein PhaeoP88_04335 [Phaeobacter inhibens]